MFAHVTTKNNIPLNLFNESKHTQKHHTDATPGLLYQALFAAFLFIPVLFHTTPSSRILSTTDPGSEEKIK